jgi:hypothetical protein
VLERCKPLERLVSAPQKNNFDFNQTVEWNRYGLELDKIDLITVIEERWVL